MWPWVERGGFTAACFLIAFWVSRRIDRSEERANAKIDSLESYIRNELAELVTNCTVALNRVHDYLKSKEPKEPG